MLKKWYGTSVMAAAAMLDVTDEDILSFSNGEIDKIDIENDDGEFSCSDPGCLLDSEVFGKYGSADMGHIKLPVPIVNINYLYGECPLLMHITGLTSPQIERVVYAQWDICVDENDPEYLKVGLVKTDNENARLNCPEESCARGAEAIERILDNSACREALEKYGVKKECIILHNVPVLPSCFRFHEEATGVLVPYGTERLYCRLIGRIERVKKGMEIGFPEVLMMNEIRMMREAADELINNGARGKIVSAGNSPCDSLNELYRMIHDMDFKETPDPDISEAPFDEEAFAAVCGEAPCCGGSAPEGADEDFESGEAFERAKNAVREVLRPMCGYLFDKYLADFNDFKDRFIEYGLPEDPCAAARESECENAKERLAYAMLRRMYFYKRKGITR